MALSMGYDLAAYWTNRHDTLERAARQLFMFLSGLRAVGEHYPGWLASDPDDGEALELVSADACLEALRKGAAPWKTGEVARTAYQARLRSLPGAATKASIALTFGLESMAELGVYVPNRIIMSVDAALADRHVAERSLRTLVATLRPDWALVDQRMAWLKPVPVTGHGKAQIGWLSYLSKRYPRLPNRLPERVVKLAVGSQGDLLAAHSSLYHRGEPSQRQAVSELDDCLRRAKVLVSAGELLDDGVAQRGSA